MTAAADIKKIGFGGSAPTAADAAPRAISKSIVETPMLPAAQVFRGADGTRPALEVKGVEDLTDADWSRIAALHADDAVLDSGSRSLMAAKNPDAPIAAPRAMSKFRVESPLIRMIGNFQSSIALDTVRNEYLYHVQIHRWLADPAQVALTKDLSLLNARIYAELFLTPDSDPWLGLVPANTYSGLDDDGVCH